MGSCCQCLFRFCCDARGDEDDQHHHEQAALAFGGDAGQQGAGHDPARMSHEERGLVHSSSSRTDIDDDDEGSSTQQNECSQHTQGMLAFFQQLGERLRGTGGEYDRILHSAPSTPPPSCKKVPPSPLRQAKSFDSSTDIPCISASEVVFPGSDLQKEMALLMAKSKLTNADVECVICMEGFDPTNPRMPTLCGCGENKTFFHLPCLYQWLEQSENCPSCREKLNWDEFD